MARFRWNSQSQPLLGGVRVERGRESMGAKFCDTFKLIKCIHERNVLWDSSDDEYLNKELARIAWEDISKEIGFPVEECRKKWRSLKDVYRKEMKKLDSGKKVIWKYMKSLEFLSDRYKASNPSNASNIKMEEYIQSETTSSMDAESLSKEPLRKIASKEDTESNYSACFLSREREGKERFKRLRLEHDDIIDEDYHFLVSLLPSMRALPQKRKNVVRSKVLQILCEENV